jgi:hypothetical protein
VMTFFLKGTLIFDAARRKLSEHQNLNSLFPTKVQRKSDKLVFLEGTRTLLMAEIWRKYMRFHDKWVPVTMARCVLRLQMEKQPPIWKAAARILNNQSLTADKGWSSSLGFGWGANKSSRYKMALLQNKYMCLRPWMILWYDLSNGKGTWDLVHGI